jgi:molecular chaperone DnaK (HSP70)
MLTRTKFEELNKELFSKLLTPLKNVMKGRLEEILMYHHRQSVYADGFLLTSTVAKVDISDIHHVVLTGGSSRITKVLSLAFLNNSGITLSSNIF